MHSCPYQNTDIPVYQILIPGGGGMNMLSMWYFIVLHFVWNIKSTRQFKKNLSKWSNFIFFILFYVFYFHLP